MSKRTKLLKGSTVLLVALATGCASPAGGPSNPASDLGPKAGAGLISNNAGGLISNNAGGLISNNAGGLISNNAGGLISNNAGGLISNNAGGLISNNAGGLTGTVKGPAAGLISNNAGGLISNNAGGLISNNAGGLISNNAGGLISNNAGGYNVLQAAEGNTRTIAGARVAVFNERGEQVSYAWTTTDANGNYSFKRLKPSGPLLFVKAVYQEDGQQVTLTSCAPAPRKAGNLEVAVSPATTFVAKKVGEMARLRVVSVVAIKTETVNEIVAKLEPVMSDRAIVAAAIFAPEEAAETFDNLMEESPTFKGTLTAALASSGAAATVLVSKTPDEPVNPAITIQPDPVTTAPDPVASTPVTDPSAPAVEPDPELPSAPPPTPNKGVAGTFGNGSVNGQLATSAGSLLLANRALYTSPLGLTGTFSSDGATNLLAVAFDGTTRYSLTVDTGAGTGAVESGAKRVEDARLVNCVDLAVLNGKAYATDPSRHVIYQIDLDAAGDKVSVYSGATDSPGAIDASTAAAARFKAPRGIVAADGKLFVADSGNNRIREISAAGSVSTLAGADAGHADGVRNGARFETPYDVTALGDALYVADTLNHVIRKVTFDGVVSTISGAIKTPGLTDGAGAEAKFSQPRAITGTTVGGKDTLYVIQVGDKVRTVQDW